MTQVTYHKNCIKHDEVKKVKRMLNKIVKHSESFNDHFVCHIDLTGVFDVDFRNVRYYLLKHLVHLKDATENQTLKNQLYIDGTVNECFDGEFDITMLSEYCYKVESLDKVMLLLHEYPVMVKKEYTFNFSGGTYIDKYKELENYLKEKSLVGFEPESYIILESGETIKINPLFFEKRYFENAKGNIIFLDSEALGTIKVDDVRDLLKRISLRNWDSNSG